MNGISSRRISKHAVAPNFNIDQMLFLVSPGFGKEPRDTFTAACQTLDGFAVFRVNQAFTTGIEMEFESLVFVHTRRDFDVDFEPMG